MSFHKSVARSIVAAILSTAMVNGQTPQQDSSRQSPDWKSLIPKIEQLKMCDDEQRWIVVVQTADVTGDGVPEALVEFCHMGAYTSQATVLQLKNGNPVESKFRDENGHLTHPIFLRGASVRNGENTALLPKLHAVYAIHWHTDDSGALAACTTEAYVWNASSRTFDSNAKISKELDRSECQKLKNEL